jgi:metal-responsive CopG/Arc/MetJ family transcriptional regulator
MCKMSRLGRPTSTIRRREATISLQQKYLDTLARICHDPFFQKRKHGLRNELIEEALSEYFKRRKIELKGDEAEAGNND